MNSGAVVVLSLIGFGWLGVAGLTPIVFLAIHDLVAIWHSYRRQHLGD